MRISEILWKAASMESPGTLRGRIVAAQGMPCEADANHRIFVLIAEPRARRPWLHHQKHTPLQSRGRLCHSGINSLGLGFCDFFFIPVSAAAPAGAEFLAFFGRHLVPALGHAALPRPRWRAGTAEAAEQDLTQDEQAESLPEGDGTSANHLRHQVVPQLHHDEAEHCSDHQTDNNKSQTA